jgi:DNA-binding PucR family transcriptional regulator
LSDIEFNFRKYALNELILNAQNDLPLDTYYPDGLRRLISHDEESNTSYIETLRVYLNNNMAATKTAGDLFIHRSTLLERLDRINAILKEDLKDPDVRLQLMIILKALEIEKQLK